MWLHLYLLVTAFAAALLFNSTSAEMPVATPTILNRPGEDLNTNNQAEDSQSADTRTSSHSISESILSDILPPKYRAFQPTAINVVAITVWILLPLISWVSMVPVAVFYTDVFEYLLGVEDFDDIMGGPDGTGTLEIIEDAFHGVFF